MATEASVRACPHGVVDDICVECSGVRYLGDLQRLKLEPGDILVLKVKERISLETSRKLGASLEACVPGHRVLVLDGECEMGVLGK